MRLGYMREITEKSLNFTAHSIRMSLFDTPSVLLSAHTAKVLCVRRRDHTDLSRISIRLIDQSTALYCSVLASCEGLTDASPKSRKFFNSSRNIAQKALTLFGNLHRCQSDSERLCLLIYLNSQIEACLCDSRRLRFSIASAHDKIFYALPELELVTLCTEILKKSLRVADLSSEVYNKFTLCT